jgi:hypothetical protein
MASFTEQATLLVRDRSVAIARTYNVHHSMISRLGNRHLPWPSCHSALISEPRSDLR